MCGWHSHDAQRGQRQCGNRRARAPRGAGAEDAARRGPHRPLPEPLRAGQPQHLHRHPQPHRGSHHRLPRPDTLPGQCTCWSHRSLSHTAGHALCLHADAAIWRLGQSDEPGCHRLWNRGRWLHCHPRRYSGPPLQQATQ